uniref:2'-deoxynucleoside 5'-phosphate N-hydrolase 1 n=1 Tax=Oreochromis aureus TaxID=47969 RepID=A0A668VK57_OREAU
MKVYFCGSIRGGRDDVHVYRRIVHALQSYGTVLTEHVSSTFKIRVCVFVCPLCH